MSTESKRYLDVGLVRTRFNYDPETGSVTYSGRERAHLSPSMRSRKTGRTVGWPDTNGHLNVKINTKDYLLHRVIWLHQFGEWPDGIIDHINGNKKDNRMSNLRLVDHSANCQNIKNPYACNTSGHLGVTRGYKEGLWAVNIRVNRIAIYLGSSSDKDVAASVYLNAKILVHPSSPVVDGLKPDLSVFGDVARRNLQKAGYWPS